jgi:hypothetical protein
VALRSASVMIQSLVRLSAANHYGFAAVPLTFAAISSAALAVACTYAPEASKRSRSN